MWFFDWQRCHLCNIAPPLVRYGDEPLGPVPGDDNARAWYNSSGFPGWIWKGDTSSDEIVGHVLFHAAIGAGHRTTH